MRKMKTGTELFDEKFFKYFEDYQDSKFEARKWCGNKAC